MDDDCRCRQEMCELNPDGRCIVQKVVEFMIEWEKRTIGKSPDETTKAEVK